MNQQAIAKNVELKQNSATRDILRNRNELIENEMTSLKRKNSDLNDALNKSVKQSDMERSEVSILINKLASMEAEKLNAVSSLKGSSNLLSETNVLSNVLFDFFSSIYCFRRKMQATGRKRKQVGRNDCTLWNGSKGEAMHEP